MFKNFIENLKAKITKERQYEAQRKWDAVKEALARKFTADDMRSDGVNLPVWCRVKEEMKKIKTRKMLDHYYDRYVKKSRKK